MQLNLVLTVNDLFIDSTGSENWDNGRTYTFGRPPNKHCGCGHDTHHRYHTLVYQYHALTISINR